MNKNPLSSPFQRRVMQSPPNPHSGSCNYLEHTEVADLKKPSDTSVLKEQFYADEDSLNMHKGALATPMGTAIPNIGHK